MPLTFKINRFPPLSALQEHAFESSQKYKEGKFIIELAHMIDQGQRLGLKPGRDGWRDKQNRY